MGGESNNAHNSHRKRKSNLTNESFLSRCRTITCKPKTRNARSSVARSTVHCEIWIEEHKIQSVVFYFVGHESFEAPNSSFKEFQHSRTMKGPDDPPAVPRSLWMIDAVHLSMWSRLMDSSHSDQTCNSTHERLSPKFNECSGGCPTVVPGGHQHARIGQISTKVSISALFCHMRSILRLSPQDSWSVLHIPM